MKQPRETIHFLTSSNPPDTPWGPAKTKTVLAEGIEFYDTGEHGGYLLHSKRIAKMPHPLGNLGTKHGPGWYEAGAHDWALVVLSFPELFEGIAIFAACEVILSDCPLHLKGVDVWLGTPAAKPLRDRCDAFYDANKTKFRLLYITRDAAGGSLLHCRAVTLDRTQAVVFITTSDAPELPPLFTMDQLLDSKATILRTATAETITNETPAP